MGSPFNADSKASTRCHIIKPNGTKLVLQFNPTNIPYGRSANFAEISSPGMSYPLIQYVGGNSVEFSFEAFYYDKPYTGKISQARRFLEGLLPPKDNTPFFRKPSTFILAYGYIIKRLVLVSLEVNDKELDKHGRPVISTFTLTVKQVGK